MKLFNDYTYEYTDQELQYYSSMGIEMDKLKLLYKPLLKDWLEDKLTKEELFSYLEPLSSNQEKQFIDYLEGELDFLDPDEKILDLLELLDPI